MSLQRVAFAFSAPVRDAHKHDPHTNIDLSTQQFSSPQPLAAGWVAQSVTLSTKFLKMLGREGAHGSRAQASKPEQAPRAHTGAHPRPGLLYAQTRGVNCSRVTVCSAGTTYEPLWVVHPLEGTAVTVATTEVLPPAVPGAGPTRRAADSVV